MKKLLLFFLISLSHSPKALIHEKILVRINENTILLSDLLEKRRDLIKNNLLLKKHPLFPFFSRKKLISDKNALIDFMILDHILD